MDPTLLTALVGVGEQGLMLVALVLLVWRVESWMRTLAERQETQHQRMMERVDAAIDRLGAKFDRLADEVAAQRRGPWHVPAGE